MSDLANFPTGWTPRILATAMLGGGYYTGVTTGGIYRGDRVQVSIFGANCKIQLTNYYLRTVLLRSTLLLRYRTFSGSVIWREFLFFYVFSA